MGTVAPVRVEEQTTIGVDNEGARFLQACADEHLAVETVQLGHLDCVGRLVAPVEVAPQPVDRDAVGVA